MGYLCTRLDPGERNARTIEEHQTSSRGAPDTGLDCHNDDRLADILQYTGSAVYGKWADGVTPMLLEDNLTIGCLRAEPHHYKRKQTGWGETPHPMGVEAMFNPASEQTRPDSQLFQKGSSDAIWRHSLSLPHSRNHHYPENYTSNMSEAAERF